MSTTSRTRKFVAGFTLGGLVLPLGWAAVAGAQDNGPTATTEQRQGPRQGPGEGRRGRLAGHLKARAEKLAAELGVTTDQLREAIKTARQNKPAQPISDPAERRAYWQEQIAKALGVSVEDLQAAGRSALTQGIDDAVAKGKLTAEQGAKLKDALAQGPEAMREARKEIRMAKMKERMPERLAKAVEKGRITQAQADEIASRINSGEQPREVLKDVLGASFGRHRGGAPAPTTTAG